MAEKGISWGIVGGGMLGLTLAHRLAQAGHRVTVIEAAPTLGGLAQPWQVGGVTWDRYYHVTLMSDAALRKLLGELALDDRIRWSITRTGFFGRGRLYPMNHAFDYLRFPLLGLIDKVRLALTLMYVSRLTDGQRLEHIAIADWLTQLSGSAVFEQIWRPLLRAKLGENYRRSSASFIWAVVRRLNAARRSGMKREMFGYVPGGYKAILDRLAARLVEEGVTLSPATPVNRIRHDGRQVVVDTEHGQQRFDQVVVTAAASLASRLIPDLKPAEHQRLNDIVYQGIVCVSVLLSRPLSGDYLTYITDEEIPFTAVVEMTGLIDPAEVGGYTLLYLPKYVTADDPAYVLSDDEIERLFLDGLRRIHPDLTDDQVVAFRVSRVREVLAIPTLGYSDRLPAQTTSVAGVHIVNSAHIVNGTLNVNETVALAEETVPMLLAAAADARTVAEKEPLPA